MGEVKEAGCVERGVESVWRESKREAGCNETVEGCVKASSGCVDLPRERDGLAWPGIASLSMRHSLLLQEGGRRLVGGFIGCVGGHLVQCELVVPLTRDSPVLVTVPESDCIKQHLERERERD